MARNVKAGSVSSGICITLGETNTREAVCAQGEVHNVAPSQPVPTHPEEFFKWLSGRVLNAADKGHNWAVLGVPGTVTRKTISLPNVKDAKDQRLNFQERLAVADPATRRLITDEGFAVYAENDATLAAHAAANRVADPKKHQRVAALVIDAGISAGLVRQKWGVYRPDGLPYAIGHLPVHSDLTSTYETMFSGSAITEQFKQNPEDLPAEHAAWVKVGQAVGSMALTLGLMSKADLVVPTGGVGAGAYEKFLPALQTYNAYNREFGTDPQMSLMPEIAAIGDEDPGYFEMYGAPGVVIAREVAQNMPQPPPTLDRRWTK